jgi:hypothetical protein
VSGNREPCAEQESEESGDEVTASLNPSTGELDTLVVLFLSGRFPRNDIFKSPITVELKSDGASLAAIYGRRRGFLCVQQGF